MAIKSPDSLAGPFLVGGLPFTLSAQRFWHDAGAMKMRVAANLSRFILALALALCKLCSSFVVTYKFMR